MSISGVGSGLYMGETYEERLSKIADKNASSAFQAAYAKKMAGSTDYISTISKAYNTGKPGATSFADAFPQYDVITHVGNPNVSSSNWQRNDFPYWKYFQKNTSAEKARLREQENKTDAFNYCGKNIGIMIKCKTVII